MRKSFLLVTCCFLLSAAVVCAAPKTYSELVAGEAFAKAAPAQRLEMLNSQLDSKELKSSDLSGDLMVRLFNDCIHSEKEAPARLDAYAKLRNQFNKLPQTYELETNLIVNFLATTAEGQKGDLVGMMKHIQTLLDAKKTCWPVVAPLHEGMLAAHLVSNAEYQKMSAKDKLAYVKKLVGESAFKDMTGTRFVRGVVTDVLMVTAEDQQKAVYDELVPLLDTFTKIAIPNGYFK
ncbi:MAG: hypothetical protein CVV41_06115 [Candidatus Riflebacteria bacterium HGW-Riflebacteria-1]|jgi:hypothetical protein|nr:MAG: hypothetical protein CVV41_06115 [Candidatus Riflebacteria bacterium HGW-Riflebacteria-1]